jgi:hypothetical protein
MDAVYEFRPKRTTGQLFHLGLMAVLALLAAWGLWQASLAFNQLLFILYLLPVAAAVLIIPMLAYRYLALRGAVYRLERDGITLRWGLRSEVIPIDSVQWVRLSQELGGALPYPWLPLPGSVVGVRRLPDDGIVEFLAASRTGLVVLATPGSLYAISPEDPRGFLAAYQRLTELGSLSPLPARSVYPTFLLARVWRTRLARSLLLIGLALNLLLLAWVGLAAPLEGDVALGGQPVPGVQLFLLPVLSIFLFLVDLFAGMFFFRRAVVQQLTPEETRWAPARYDVLAYTLWGGGVLTPLLFLLGVGFILMGG